MDPPVSLEKLHGMVATIGGVVDRFRGADIGPGASALAEGLAGTIANAMVKNVTYVAITDVQISKRRRES